MTDDPRAQHRLGMLLVALSAISWSSAGFFTRLIPLDLWTMLFWRGAFGCLFIGGYIVWSARGRIGASVRGYGWPGIFLSVCSMLATATLIPAFKFTSIANVVVIFATAPFFSAAFAWLWMREKASGPTLIAATVALLGVAYMMGGAFAGIQLGDLLAILATIVIALLMVGMRRYRSVPTLPIAFFANLFIVLACLPFAAPTEVTGLDILYSAMFAGTTMVAGYILLLAGSRMIPAVETALIGTLETPLAPLWVWIAFKEVPADATFVGGAVVLAALIGHVVVEHRRRSGATA